MNAQTIMICSGKGGTGKSTVSVLLGAQLGAWGRRVLLIEPRYWPALTQLATMLEELGRDRAALKAYRASLAVNPHQVEAEEGGARLRQAAEGTPV